MDDYVGGLLVLFTSLAIFFSLGYWYKSESVAKECKDYGVITFDGKQHSCTEKDQNAK